MQPTTARGLPVLDLDPYAEATLADPEPFHEALREVGPLAWLPAYGVYATGRYDQVRAGLSNWADLVSGAGVGILDLRHDESFRTPSLIIEADPPAHTPRRALMDSLLSARAVRHLRATFAGAADQLVTELLGRRGRGGADSIDGVADIAEVFPLTVFPDAIGLSPAVRPHLLTYGDLVFNSGGPPNALFTRALSRAEPAIAAITAQTRRDQLSEGGIGARIWDAVDDGSLPADEAPLLIRSLLTAGVDTTVAAIAATLYRLATNPDQWSRLRQDPRLARFAFEEAIRLDSPVQTFFRTARRDTDLAGATVRADHKVLLSLGAANGDPRRFPDPRRYDITRNMSGHVGFGMGIHQCVGQHFGRLEGEALITAIASRVERIELAGTPERRLNNTLRTWGRLPLRLTPRS